MSRTISSQGAHICIYRRGSHPSTIPTARQQSRSELDRTRRLHLALAHKRSFRRARRTFNFPPPTLVSSELLAASLLLPTPAHFPSTTAADHSLDLQTRPNPSCRHQTTAGTTTSSSTRFEPSNSALGKQTTDKRVARIQDPPTPQTLPAPKRWHCTHRLARPIHTVAYILHSPLCSYSSLRRLRLCLQARLSQSASLP